MTLLLDPDIRDWVVLPLFLIIVLAGLLRQVGMVYMQPTLRKAQPVRSLQAGSRQMQCGRRMRSSAAHYMTTARWATRQTHAVALLREHAERVKREASSESNESSEDPVEAMMANPMSMMGGNMVFMVQNMVMMQGIQHFFSGFILLKVPFGLTLGFKAMFQRGVPEAALEPSYVSSVSWYFLVMYGLRSLFNLLAVKPGPEQREYDVRATQQLGLMGVNSGNPLSKPPDADALAQALNAEADQLEFLVKHISEMDGVEKRLLQTKYPKRKKKSSEADFLFQKKRH